MILLSKYRRSGNPRRNRLLSCLTIDGFSMIMISLAPPRRVASGRTATRLTFG
jgi:hypothetical protein